jgi:hypothetical protein
MQAISTTRFSIKRSKFPLEFIAQLLLLLRFAATLPSLASSLKFCSVFLVFTARSPVSLPLNLQQNSNPRLSNQSRPATSAETLPLSFTAALKTRKKQPIFSFLLQLQKISLKALCSLVQNSKGIGSSHRG